MAPTISKETAQTLRNVVEMVKKIDAAYKKCEPAYRKAEANLQEAIDDKSEDELELFRPQMEKVLKEVDSCIHSISGALGLLRNLRKDEALMETRADQINALVKGLVDKQQLLAKAAAKGRTMVMDEAKKALEAAKSSNETLEAELSELKDTVNRIEKAVKYIESQAQALEAKTLAAQKAGNQKDMSAARVKYLELGYGDQEKGATLTKPKAQKLLARLKDSKQRAECQWAIDSLQNLSDRCRALSKRGSELALLKIDAKAAAPAPKPKLGSSQVQQIAKLLGLDVKDSKAISRLTKLVADHPHVAWPAQIVKQFDMKKAEVEAAMKKINQLPFVRPLYLIDI